MQFEDRFEAGSLLASKLADYRDSANGIILALPRGGVVVGFAIHEALGLPLDVFITRKLGAPENPEYALGALTETGCRFVNPDVMGLIAGPWNGDYLDKETERQGREIERRKRLYRGEGALPDLTGRTVLVVDDGVATGSTIIAAVRGISRLGPERIVVAVPVGSPQAIQALEQEADEVVAVSVPLRFRAVGEAYLRFPQVEDSEVVRHLRAARLSLPSSRSVREV